jgi:hypothetical protein
MPDLDSFASLVWGRIGPEGRELVRDSWRLIHELDPDLQPKVYACFLWATWVRGKAGMPGARADFWDKV